jgi:uncharacterized caspase-like protein
MASMLERLGFGVTLLRDADLPTMKSALRDFTQKLRHDSVGLFYFAGLGIQSASGTSGMYLAPIGARTRQADELQSNWFAVGRLLEDLGNAGNRLNIIVLAASRNNPFAQREACARGSSRGGKFIAYGCAAGAVVSEGPGRNSVFTEALLRHMSTPGLSLERLFGNVMASVMRGSQGRQAPWAEISGPEADTFYFVASK